MAGGLVATGRGTGRLDHHRDLVRPSDPLRIGCVGHRDRSTVDDQRVAVGRHLDRSVEAPVHRVTREQTSKGGGRRDVVDRHQVELGAIVGDASEGAADAAQAVDGERDRHGRKKTGGERIGMTVGIGRRRREGGRMGRLDNLTPAPAESDPVA